MFCEGPAPKTVAAPFGRLDSLFRNRTKGPRTARFGFPFGGNSTQREPSVCLRCLRVCLIFPSWSTREAIISLLDIALTFFQGAKTQMEGVATLNNAQPLRTRFDRPLGPVPWRWERRRFPRGSGMSPSKNLIGARDAGGQNQWYHFGVGAPPFSLVH